jgi:hypothetical protein
MSLLFPPFFSSPSVVSLDFLSRFFWRFVKKKKKIAAAKNAIKKIAGTFPQPPKKEKGSYLNPPLPFIFYSFTARLVCCLNGNCRKALSASTEQLRRRGAGSNFDSKEGWYLVGRWPLKQALPCPRPAGAIKGKQGHGEGGVGDRPCVKEELSKSNYGKSQ